MGADDDAKWARASQRCVEARLSEYARLHDRMPPFGLKAALQRMIQEARVEARSSTLLLQQLATCVEPPATCVCRELALLAVCARYTARITGDPPKDLARAWILAFAGYMEGLS